MSQIHSIRPSTVDPTGARSIPSVSLETKALVDFFSAKPEGTTVTFAEMEELIGRPVMHGSSGYGYLQSARRILLRDHGLLIDAEPKVGVRVCTNEEKLLVSGRDVKRARRAVKRSGQKLRAVDYNRLTDEKKREWNGRMSWASALELLSAPKAAKRIEMAVTDHALPSAKTLQLFQK